MGRANLSDLLGKVDEPTPAPAPPVGPAEKPAAEPKPVHVPRERPPLVSVDEGPLVLVETRRDLKELTLPFEQTALPL